MIYSHILSLVYPNNHLLGLQENLKKRLREKEKKKTLLLSAVDLLNNVEAYTLAFQWDLSCLTYLCFQEHVAKGKKITSSFLAYL